MDLVRFYHMVEGISTKKAQVLASQFNLDVKEVENIVHGADPTPNAQFATWILQQISKKHLRMPEDSTKTKETLGVYVRLVQGNANIDKDINSFDSFNSLYDAVSKFTTFRSRKEIEKDLSQSGMSVIHDGEDYKIFEITTPQASAKACRGTNWCVKDPAWAINYLKYGPLYLFYAKKDDNPLLIDKQKQKGKENKVDGRVALAHIDRGDIQINDASDRSLKSNKITADLLRLLASVMSPDIAYRHPRIAIQRAIQVGEKLPRNIENSRLLLDSPDRLAYFQATYKNPKVMYNRIQKDFWMTRNDTAVEWSLAKKEDLPETVKHRLMLELNLAIEWAVQAQQAGIIDYWPELETAIITSDKISKKNRKELENYTPAMAALEKILKDLDQQSKDSVPVSVPQIFAEGSPPIIFDSDDWRVHEISPFKTNSVDTDDFLQWALNAAREEASLSSADFDDWHALNDARQATAWDRVDAKLRNVWRTKMRGIALFHSAHRQNTLDYLSHSRNEIKTIQIGPAVTYVLQYRGDRANKRRGKKSFLALDFNCVLVEGQDPKWSVRIKTNDRADLEFIDFASYVQPLLEVIIKHGNWAGIKKLAQQKFNDKSVDAMQKGFAPIKSEHDLVKIGSMEHTIGIGSNRYRSPDWGSIEISVDEALDIYRESTDRVPDDWVKSFFDVANNPKILKSIKPDRRGIDPDDLTEKILDMANLGDHSLIGDSFNPFMRAYITASSEDRERMATMAKKVYWLMVTYDTPYVRYDDTVRKKQVEDWKTMRRSFIAVVNKAFSSSEKWVVTLVNLAFKQKTDVAKTNILDLLTTTEQQLPRYLEKIAEVDLGQSAAWKIYRKRFGLGTRDDEPEPTDPDELLDIPPLSKRKDDWKPYSPKFKVEGISPGAFLNLVG